MTSFSTTAAVPQIRRRLAAIGHPERAAFEKAYLKSDLRFLGVSVPVIRAEAREFAKRHPELGTEELRALVEALFATDCHELRSIGIAVLERFRQRLTANELDWLLTLVRIACNWAHVDWLATKVIGPLVSDSPRSRSLLVRWSRDPELWVRRTALLAQLDALRAGAGDFELFAHIAAPLLAEKAFFIRKAIGWVLRDVSKRRPELTAAFLLEHRAAASGLTLREGAKYLPAATRAQLFG